jgi:hypothetical protein
MAWRLRDLQYLYFIIGLRECVFQKAGSSPALVCTWTEMAVEMHIVCKCTRSVQ